MKPKVSLVLVAGGMGTRLGLPQPKAFVELAGQPLFTWSLATLAVLPYVNQIIVVCPSGYENETARLATPFASCKLVTVVAGGAERWMSVRNGVEKCSADCDLVMVHDSARPFVSATVVDALIERVDKFPCVITATPEVDTVRHFENDVCTETLDRSRIIRVGTPQVFKKSILENGFALASEMTTPPTDEAALIEKLGESVGFAWGDPMNFKVTTAADLEIAEAVMNARKSSAR